MTLYDVIIFNVILGLFCYVSNFETHCFIRRNTLFQSKKHFVSARETIYTRYLFTIIWRYLCILWRLISCLNCLLFRCLHRIWRYDVCFLKISRNHQNLNPRLKKRILKDGIFIFWKQGHNIRYRISSLIIILMLLHPKFYG